MKTTKALGFLCSIFLSASLLGGCGDPEQQPTGGTGPGSGGSTTSGGAAGTGAVGGMAGMAGMGGMAGMAGMGGSGGTTGGAGTGGMPQCMSPGDCGISDACHSYTCDAGMCTDVFTPAGTKIPAQVFGDCKTKTCDGSGGIVEGPDDTDVFDDLNDCTADVCVAGAPMNTPSPAGTACASGGGKVCDGASKCVECLTGADCAMGICAMDHTCAPASCGDGALNGSETDIDCGGAACGKCATGKKCKVATDCMEGVCDPGTLTCSAPTCMDGVKNGAETDVDCGGPTCADCAPGKQCGSPADCNSGVCSGMPLTCQAPTCMDGVKNQDETDIDCGGATCGDCAVGKDCLVGGDCVSAVCSGMPKKCQAPTCSDATKNGNETGVDCGGACPSCANGQPCNVNADCMSAFCNAMKVCAAPTCMDGAKNGAETDVDCGGAVCPTCADGKVCVSASDCSGSFCLGPPVCQSMLNGCTLATAVDHTADNVTTVTQSGFTYVPQCIKIKAGKQVTINANYLSHPLTQGPVVNGVAYPQMGGPITHTASGSTATFTFPTPGQFGYYCDFHYGLGMYGAVFVVP